MVNDANKTLAAMETVGKGWLHYEEDTTGGTNGTRCDIFAQIAFIKILSTIRSTAARRAQGFLDFLKWLMISAALSSDGACRRYAPQSSLEGVLRARASSARCARSRARHRSRQRHERSHRLSGYREFRKSHRRSGIRPGRRIGRPRQNDFGGSMPWANGTVKKPCKP